MPLGDVVPELALVVAAAIVLFAACFVPHEQHAWLASLTLVGLAVAGAASVAQLGMAPHLTFHGSHALDGPAAGAKLIVLASSAVVVGLSPEWMRTDRRHGEYYAVLLMATLGAVLLAGAADVMQMLVAALLSSITGYTLAAYHRAWGPSVEAGMKYFLLGALTNALLVAGVVWLFGLTGTTRYAELAPALSLDPQAPAAILAVGLLVVGLAFKVGAVPAHAWLPDVAEGAPAPAAAFLTVVPKVGGTLALARLCGAIPAEVGWHALLAAVAVATMTLGNLAALWQTDVRRLLGWSSVSQSGYALMAVAVLGFSEQAVPALLVFLAAYAVANLAAFGAVVQLRGRTELTGYAGLADARPWLAVVLIVAFLSLVGVPPLAGFVGKLALFAAALDGGLGWLAMVAAANTVLSLFYYLRVLAPVVLEPPGGTVAVLGRQAAIATAAAAVAVVALGLGAEAMFGLLKASTLLP